MKTKFLKYTSSYKGISYFWLLLVLGFCICFPFPVGVSLVGEISCRGSCNFKVLSFTLYLICINISIGNFCFLDNFPARVMAVQVHGTFYSTRTRPTFKNGERDVIAAQSESRSPLFFANCSFVAGVSFSQRPWFVECCCLLCSIENNAPVGMRLDPSRMAFFPRLLSQNSTLLLGYSAFVYLI